MTDTVIPVLDRRARPDTVIERAIDIADERDSTVHGLYVVDTVRCGHPALSSTETVVGEREDEGHRQLATVRERSRRRGLEATTDRRRGRPDESVLPWADRIGADVVVLDARRRRHRLVDGLDDVCERTVFASRRTPAS